VSLRVGAACARRIRADHRNAKIAKTWPSPLAHRREFEICDRQIASFKIDQQRGRQQFRRQRLEQRRLADRGFARDQILGPRSSSKRALASRSSIVIAEPR
jgi:hypothetical protein